MADMRDWTVDRRELLGVAALGGGLLLPGAAQAQKRRAPVVPLGGFTHGVASGEPSETSMLFWTRCEGVGAKAVPLSVEVSTDPRMARARVMGQALAEPAQARHDRGKVPLVMGAGVGWIWVQVGDGQRQRPQRLGDVAKCADPLTPRCS
jgi:hypothetical protein